MVSPAYMTEKPSPPGPVRRFFDQKVISFAINAAGAGEGVLERVAGRVRLNPIAGLGAAIGIGTLVTLLAVPRR